MQKKKKAIAIAVSSPSGGVGVSVFAALLAFSLMLHSKNRVRDVSQCCLIDANPSLGGLEIVMGLEQERGLRWPDISVPMGKLEPDSLVSELINWDGIATLSAQPWNGGNLHDWEISAIYEALCSTMEHIVIDVSDHKNLPTCEQIGVKRNEIENFINIVLVEMSVLGVARTKAWLSHNHSEDNTILLAIPSKMCCSKSKEIVDIEEVAHYLNQDIFGVIPPIARLEKNLLNGLGISKIPGKYKNLFESLQTYINGGDYEGR